MSNRLKHIWGILYEWLRKITPFDIAVVITFALLYLYSDEGTGIQQIIRILVFAGILFYKWLSQNPFYWLIISLFLMALNGYLWYHIDNHHFLLNYWCLALSVSCFTQKPSIYIAINARLLIGLCFLFATFWKLFSIEFVSGGYFEYVLAGGDRRFATISALITDISIETIEENQDLISLLKEEVEYDYIPIETTQRVSLMAIIMTWTIILMEALIAYLFLHKGNGKLNVVRHFMLGIFILGTYSLIPVLGFGWILIAMGLVQITKYKKPLLSWYVGIFVLITSLYYGRQIIRDILTGIFM